MKRTIVILATALFSALLMLSPTVFAKARTLGEVGVIHVDSNQCAGSLKNALWDDGFGMSNSSDAADATLVVSMRERTNESVGKDGRYTAKLVGAHGKVLMSFSGHENSIDHEALCADISDDIADRIG